MSFKGKASLGVKFDRGERVKQVGFFEAFPSNLEFGRKYDYKSLKNGRTEEGRFTPPERTFLFDKQRPIEAIKVTEEYFKSGTNFKNIFFKVEAAEEAEGYFGKLEKEVAQVEMLQYGQKILERGRAKEGKEDDNLTKEYTLEEVKKDIFGKVERRNGGKKT